MLDDQTQPMPWAIITPSYNLDLRRCKLQCRSMDAFLTGPWHHYIIVDPVDLPLFSPLASSRRNIINKADILPAGMRYLGKVPFMRLGRLWYSWRHGPVFGWQMQQIVKMLMASFLKENAIVFCDSDIFFLRPFNISALEREGRVKFSSEEVQKVFDHKLIRNSVELLGLNPLETTRLATDDPMVTWHRPTAIALQEYLTELHKRPWHEAIGSKIMFAEFQMYSLFVDYIQKNNPLIYRDNTVYCKTLWTKEQAHETDIETFCTNLTQNQVAVCIQSLIGIDLDLLERQFQKSLM